MKQFYRATRFQKATLKLIDQANEIIAKYQAEGYVLTIRQLHYQFVARDLLPNTTATYDKICTTMTDARLAGMVDWDAIEDRGRTLRGLDFQASPKNAVNRLLDAYVLNPWQDQECHPEVWIEKDALIGAIDPICSRLRVDYFSCRGYSSCTEMLVAGRRFERYDAEGRQPVVLYLGDHDPSGLDMARDIRARLEMFAGFEVPVHSVALTMDQVRRYSLPPNFAKKEDARYQAYKEQHGEDCWELDALEPAVLQDLIETKVAALIDQHAWRQTLDRESVEIGDLAAARDLLGESRGQ